MKKIIHKLANKIPVLAAIIFPISKMGSLSK